MKDTSTCLLLVAGCCLMLAFDVAHAHDKQETCSTLCPPGYAGSVPKRRQPLICNLCKKNEFKSAVSNCCVKCEDGILIRDAAGLAINCTACPAGSKPSKDSATNTSTCWCKDGWQATGADPVTGVSGCKRCDPGTFNPNRTQSQTACLPCPAGTVAPLNGSELCFNCSQWNNTEFVSADKPCFCKAGFFFKPLGGRRKSRGHLRMLLRENEGERGKGPKDKGPKDKGPKEKGPDDKGPDDKGIKGFDDKFPLFPFLKLDDDFFKKQSCRACNTSTDNGQLNLWPVCCTAGQAWNGSVCGTV